MTMIRCWRSARLLLVESDGRDAPSGHRDGACAAQRHLPSAQAETVHRGARRRSDLDTRQRDHVPVQMANCLRSERRTNFPGSHDGQQESN